MYKTLLGAIPCCTYHSSLGQLIYVGKQKSFTIKFTKHRFGSAIPFPESRITQITLNTWIRLMHETVLMRISLSETGYLVAGASPCNP